jgi:hypothetical protein
MDETRISKTSLIKYIDAEQQERNEEFNIELPEEVPQVHGHPPPPKTKAKGTIRLIYENVNGIRNHMSNKDNSTGPRRFMMIWK